MTEQSPPQKIFTKTLLLGIGLFGFLLIFDTVLSHWNDRQIAAGADRVMLTNDTLAALKDLLSTMKDAETGERGYLITGEPRYLEPYQAATAAIENNIQRVRQLTQDDDWAKSRLPPLKETIDAKLAELKKTIALRDQDLEIARREVQTHLGKNLMDGIREKIRELENHEGEMLRIQKRESEPAFTVSMATNALATIVGLALLAGFVYVLQGYLRTRNEAAAVLYEQREWLRITLSSIGDAVIATDIEGRVKNINRVALSMIAFREEEAVGKPLEEVFQIVNEKTRQKCENPVAHVLRDGKVVGLANHTALIAKDGIERSIADSAAPIRDAAGAITGVVLVFRDVTESKRTEEAMVRLASFPTLNPQPIVEADFSGRLHYLNPAIKRLFPDLQALEREHPWMADWDNLVRSFREEGVQNLSREVAIGDRCYSQTVSHIREIDRIRIYGTDITLQKQAEALQTQERANLQAIFDVVNVGMLLIDESGAVRRVNNTVSRWVGKDLSGFLGVQPGGLIGCIHAANDPLDCGKTPHCSECPVRNTFETVLRTDRPVHDVEAPAILSIGGKSMHLWFKVSADPLVLDGRRQVIMSLNDITHEKQAEEALQKAKDNLEQRVADRTQELDRAYRYARSLIEASLDPLVMISPSGRISDVNCATEAVTGIGRKDIIGSDFSQYFTQPEKAEEVYRKVLDEGKVNDYPLTVRHAEGRLTDVLYNAAVYHDEAGKVQGVFAAARNITERKKAEEELKNYRQHLEELVAQRTEELSRSNQDLEQFAYVASHDLQEPLRMVGGYLELLSDRYKGKLDEKADKYINYAVDGAQRMSGLIRDLLAYSRVNSRGAELTCLNSEEAFEAALKNLTTAIRENGAEITHDSLPTVRADITQLTQVFQNLIGNAVKFREPQRPPRIHVSACEDGKQWVFSVRDNGIGFEQQYEEKIFMIFQRLHGRGYYPGTGIGLAICKRIIERHGGKIWVNSAPGEGTTFFFTLQK